MSNWTKFPKSLRDNISAPRSPICVSNKTPIKTTNYGREDVLTTRLKYNIYIKKVLYIQVVINIYIFIHTQICLFPTLVYFREVYVNFIVVSICVKQSW